ncbi:hypothetical protein T01_12428 [Trichinella spiralis]|uniref:Uncharacterized protein n=1 Tax=Trichinella spiralis TaxID=6334 RepID=A0A0V1BDQ0_TRISP|nr:hypothetical protein T01_12428 [Trichinella spiralis]
MFQFNKVYWGTSEQQPMKYRGLNCAFSVLTNIRDYPSFFLSIVAVFYESDLSSPSRSRHLLIRLSPDRLISVVLIHP